MMPKYTAQHDDFIVTYFDVVGDIIENDLPHSLASIKKRAKLLKESGVWKAMELLQRLEWITLRERELLKPTQALMFLDEMHSGSMIDACHFSDLVTAKEYAKETEEWFADCKAKFLTQEQFRVDEYYKKLLKLSN